MQIFNLWMEILSRMLKYYLYNGALRKNCNSAISKISLHGKTREVKQRYGNKTKRKDCQGQIYLWVEQITAKHVDMIVLANASK